MLAVVVLPKMPVVIAAESTYRLASGRETAVEALAEQIDARVLVGVGMDHHRPGRHHLDRPDHDRAPGGGALAVRVARCGEQVERQDAVDAGRIGMVRGGGLTRGDADVARDRPGLL